MRAPMNQTSPALLPTRAALLGEIDAFCRKHNMSATRFGTLFSGDTTLLMRIRGGSSIGIDRLDKLRDFMANYRPEDEAK